MSHWKSSRKVVELFLPIFYWIRSWMIHAWYKIYYSPSFTPSPIGGRLCFNDTLSWIISLKLQSHIHGSGGGSWRISDGCGPPWSVLIRHHPPSSQSHYGGYATFLLRTRYDLMLSDGGLAADWRRTSVVWRSTAAILLPWSVCVPPKSARKCSKSAQRRSSVAKVRSWDVRVS